MNTRQKDILHLHSAWVLQMCHAEKIRDCNYRDSLVLCGSCHRLNSRVQHTRPAAPRLHPLQCTTSVVVINAWYKQKSSSIFKKTLSILATTHIIQFPSAN